MVVRHLMARLHVVGHLHQVIGESRPNAAGHESRDGVAQLRGLIGPHRTAPPKWIKAAAGHDLPVGNQPAVLKREGFQWGLGARDWELVAAEVPSPRSPRVLLHPLADHVDQFACRLAGLRDERRRFFERRVGRGDGFAEDRIDALCRGVADALAKLALVETYRPDEIAAGLERAVAGKTSPTADRPIVRRRRAKAGDLGGPALPEDAVGRRPTRPRRIGPAVDQV